MPDLSFKVEEAAVVPYAITPTLGLKLRVTNADPTEAIHTVALRCQIHIDVTRRRYTAEEQASMRDLFGEPERWSQTLRTLLWTHVSVVVPSFTGSTLVELPIQCTFDFNVAVTKYFDGLRGGEIPLQLLFSGTVFYADPDDGLQVAPISWTQEAQFRLPAKLWQDMMDAYYPNTAWLNLRRDVFERLYEYKMRNGLPTWEQALERVLPVEEAVNS
jgi:hypothetical protein